MRRQVIHLDSYEHKLHLNIQVMSYYLQLFKL